MTLGDDEAELQRHWMDEAMALMRQQKFREALESLHRVMDMGGELGAKARTFIMFIVRSDLAGLPARRGHDSEAAGSASRHVDAHRARAHHIAPPDQGTRKRGKRAKRRRKTDIVRRTPHMDVSPKTPRRPGDTFEVIVYADTKAARTGEDATDMELEFPDGVDALSVTVEILPTRHFVVAGQCLQRIELDRDTERSTEARFTLHTRAADQIYCLEEGPAITAYFTYEGRSCGKVRRKFTLAATAKSASQRDAPTSRDGHSACGAISILTSAQPPDLTIQILDPMRSHRNLRCTVYSPHLDDLRDGKSGDWNLPKSTGELVTGYFEEFISAPTDPRETVMRLRGVGIKLFQAAPSIFLDAFWALRDNECPLRSIYVVSEEPYFPWELMLPNRRVPGAHREIATHALGAEFLVGRWVNDAFLSPRQRKMLRTGVAIVPAYQGGQQLPNAAKELSHIRKRFAVEEVAPVTIQMIDRTLASAGVSFVHFACHGQARSQSGVMSIQLATEEERLTEVVLNGMEGARRGCESNNPLVFLNACEMGRQQIALSGVDGFAPTFLDMGATGVIAPLWSVDDSVALQAAQEFYDRVKKEPHTPFSEIVRDLRRRSYEDPWEDSWAAYCFYGDPLAAQIDGPV